MRLFRLTRQITTGPALFACCGLLLAGCERSMDDIRLRQQALSEAASVAPVALALPEIPSARQIRYRVERLPSPFARPQPAVIALAGQRAAAEPGAVDDPGPGAQAGSVPADSECLQPDSKRQPQVMEQYPLSSMVMRGAISRQGSTSWALIDAGNGQLHRIAAGDYLGQDHGQVTAVTDRETEIRELVPDGSGCWQMRLTQLTLITR